MSENKLELELLTRKLMEGVIDYGILNVSTIQYQTACNSIMNYAKSLGVSSYSEALMDGYSAYLDQRVEAGDMCIEYRRLQKRVMRMLSSLAQKGEIDFSTAESSNRKYPVSEEISLLIEEVLDDKSISEKTRKDLRGPLRHLFWYAAQQNILPSEINDVLIMKFLMEEVPKTNGGSTGRTLRCIKYAAFYLSSHGNNSIKHDYTMLTLKNDHRRIIPAFSEEEITGIASSVDTGTLLGKRDLAIILLAYCTGLRGADIVCIKLSDVNWRKQHISVVQSKTHAPLIVEINGAVMNVLADYVLEARPSCSVPELFLTVKAPYRKLSHGFGSMVDKYCEKAAVDKIPFRAFHSLRRSFETVMISNGVPIETASQMMGHKTIIEDKPYITHNREKTALVALDFSDVPITSGLYAKTGKSPSFRKGGDGK